jgi:formylglycine-generating enzyme required for sulfatase activity
MKTAIFFFLYLIFFQFSFSQDILKLNGKKTSLVSIGKQNVFADKYEVSNFDYLEFLSWIRKSKGETEYLKNLPDTTIWRSPLGSMEHFVNYYFRHPAYRDYPVVGINYEQAINYCNWLNEHYKENLADKKIKKIQFRLPTEEEWEIAARGGLPEGTIFPWGTKSIRMDKGKYEGAIRANFMRGSGDYMGGAGNLNDGASPTSPVHSYWPNNYGLFHLSGNVAEMVAEKSICKGGSWFDAGYKMVISSRDTFNNASKKVGFRVFAEVEEYDVPKSDLIVNAKYIEDILSYIPAGAVQSPGYGELFKDTSDVFVSGAFHVSKFEVSNELYLNFLGDIKDSIKRLAYLPVDENWKTETDMLQYQHYSTQFPNHPVVNITKEAMVAFCDWLSEQYNKDPNRKFEQAQFSLPTAKQQIVAMRSGKTLSMYSWGGPYSQNSKGKHLMNYNPLFDFIGYNEIKLTSDLAYRKSQHSLLQKSRALDGFELTAPVNAFNPSEFGMYNINGNVSEVIMDSDIVFGGSFASMTDNCRNLEENFQIEKISLPSPQVGFRFVMDGKYNQVEHKK